MTEAHEQDVVSDVRERIAKALERLIASEAALQKVEEASQLLSQVRGVRDFFLLGAEQAWRLVNEYDRLVEFQGQAGAEVVLKMEESKHHGENLFLSSKEEERDLAAFDCYSLYKHCDGSYEWRLCKIMHKEPVVGQEQDSDPLSQKFNYWIEFLHHRKTGQKLWLKRRREEILMSARYAREQQRNYEQETLKFIRETYSELQGKGKQAVLRSVAKNLNDQFLDSK